MEGFGYLEWTLRRRDWCLTGGNWENIGASERALPSRRLKRLPAGGFEISSALAQGDLEVQRPVRRRADSDATCLRALVVGVNKGDSNVSGWMLVAPLLNVHFAAAAATTLPLGPPDAQGHREAFPFLARTYAIGGSGVLGDVEAYATQSNLWKNAAPLPTPRLELAATVGGPDLDIYAVGGSDGTNPLQALEAFQPSVGFHFHGGGGWNPLTPMPTARTRLAAATGPDGRIYAFGGFDGSTALKINEVYDIQTDTWTTVAPMNTARDGVAGATGPDGRIYAIGGFDNVHYLSSVEAYDPLTDKWTTVASMAHPRMSLGAATGTDKRIYAIGGEFFSAVNIVEAYDPSANTWVAVTPMITPRRALAAAVGHDGRIYALGGIDNITGPLSSVEAFSL